MRRHRGDRGERQATISSRAPTMALTVDYCRLASSLAFTLKVSRPFDRSGARHRWRSATPLSSPKRNCARKARTAVVRDVVAHELIELSAGERRSSTMPLGPRRGEQRCGLRWSDVDMTSMIVGGASARKRLPEDLLERRPHSVAQMRLAISSAPATANAATQSRSKFSQALRRTATPRHSCTTTAMTAVVASIASV